MYKLVECGHLLKNRIFDYKKFDRSNFAKIEKIVPQLSGAVILHVNATPKGGGVAEILRSQINIEKQLGIRSYWFATQVDANFFRVTKKLHNLLQGEPGTLTPAEKKAYLHANRILGEGLGKLIKRLNPNLIIIHDPQPLPLIKEVSGSIPTVLRLHIDLSSSSRALQFLKPMISNYSAVIVSDKRYFKNFEWFRKPSWTIMPAIDPLVEKNLEMTLADAQSILKKFGLNPKMPIIAQVSRFDKWKDPLGVLRAYQIAKKKYPGLQLILAGFIVAQDDPEALGLSKKVKEKAGPDSDVHLFTDTRVFRTVSNDDFIRAVYTASDIVIQKSLREGFGLTMTEAMWKAKAVVAGDTAGAHLQIVNGTNGVIVSSAEGAAQAILKLLDHPKQIEKIGSAAKKSVRKQFLIPRFILENLLIYSKLLQ